MFNIVSIRWAQPLNQTVQTTTTWTTCEIATRVSTECFSSQRVESLACDRKIFHASHCHSISRQIVMHTKMVKILSMAEFRT